MRLPPIPPDRLSPSQRRLYDTMDATVTEHLKGFVSKRADGALVGPFNPMLHFPQFGEAVWAYTAAMIANTTLPRPAHEVAILVTGARFDSRYELYAHEHVAASAGLSAEKIATIAAGGRPPDLGADESVAYDVATALCDGKKLPESTYRASVARFGDDGTAELVFLVAHYVVVSTILNAYDVSVPGREEGLPTG